MVSLIVVLFGLSLILLLAEINWRKKMIKGEYSRKFVHICFGVFVASWPWMLSWDQIKLLGLASLVFALLNRYNKIFHYFGLVKRRGYGDVTFALALFICPFLTHQKLFFALAILHVALADGLAAIIGRNYGMSLKYKVLGHTKTLLGSMVFWFTSLLILGIGLLPAHDLINFHAYTLIVLFGPPILTVLENIAVFGLDNLVLPPAVLLALYLAQTV